MPAAVCREGRAWCGGSSIRSTRRGASRSTWTSGCTIERASNELARALYGDGPYGSPLIGTEATTGAITRDDVEAFYQRHILPAGSALLAIGDIEPESFAASAEELLGGWISTGPRGASPEIRPERRKRVSVTIVDRPEAAQTELRLGHPGVARNHPDYPVLQVMNSLLGGKFTSRINLNLRERHGFTYGANSRFTARRGPGPFVVSTAVANDVTGRAVREILSELRRIRDERVGDDELAETRSYIEGVFPYTLQGLDGLASRIHSLKLHDLPDDYYDHYLCQIRETTPQDVQEVAQRHLHPELIAIVAAGPAEDLRSQLESLAPVEVVEPT